MESSKNLIVDDDLKPFAHWMTDDDKIFLPSKVAFPKMPAGYYKIKYNDNYGYFLETVENFNHNEESINQISESTIKEIELFWELEEKYKKSNLSFKKGVLIYGPPGNGKNFILNKIIQKNIEKDKLVLEVEDMEDCIYFVPTIRKIEPEREIVLIIKDLENMMNKSGIAPAMEMFEDLTHMNRIVYITTINFIENVNQIIYNTPNVFDKKIKIGLPSLKEREEFITDRIKDLETAQRVGAKKCARDTEGFSFSNLNQLITSVFIGNENYNEKIKEIVKNNKDIHMFEQSSNEMGFRYNENENN